MELIGREIFAVGKWNDMTFSVDDLDEIAANFEALGEVHKVPLKFGHNEDQPITDGQPAIGWVEKVYRQGNKLLADFQNMPNTVYEAVKSKLYRTVSIELLFDVDHSGRRFGFVLDAVALLGSDHPAVNSLKDLDALLASRTSFAGGRRLCFETIAGKSAKRLRSNGNGKNNEDFDMDKDELKKFVSDAVETAMKPVNAELDAVTKDRDELKAKFERSEKDKADFEAAEKDKKIKMARKTVTEILDTAVTEKRMTPAQRELYSAQIGVDDDDRVLEINADDVKKVFNVVTKAGKSARDDDSDEHTDDPAQELTTLSHAYMAEHGEKSFVAAFTTVARGNPALHRAYLDSNGG